MTPPQSKGRAELAAMIALAFPVVLSELGWTAQGIVDTIMVGRLGPAAIGAVAIGNAVYFTPTLFCVGLLLGLDTLVSQAYGRRDHDECHRWLAQGVYIVFLLTPPLMLLLFAASFGFVRFGITPEVAACLLYTSELHAHAIGRGQRLHHPHRRRRQLAADGDAERNGIGAAHRHALHLFAELFRDRRRRCV